LLCAMPRRPLSLARRPSAYPPWYCQRCLCLWFVHGMSFTDVARRMGCERRTVTRMTERFLAGRPLQAAGQTGRISPYRAMNAALTADLLRLVSERNDLFLSEIVHELYLLHGVVVSVSQVCRALSYNNITRKKVGGNVGVSLPRSVLRRAVVLGVLGDRYALVLLAGLTGLCGAQLQKRSSEARADLREAFKEVVKNVPLCRLYFIDESAVVRPLRAGESVGECEHCTGTCSTACTSSCTWTGADTLSVG
jgi:transposase